MKHKTRLTALLTAIVILAAMLPASFAEEGLSFRDVSESDWYNQAVGFAVGRGLMSGYSDEAFGPTDTLKRNMLAQVFYNWEQQPYGGENEEKPWAGEAPFADVKAGVWYENAVNWARSEKVMQGDGTSFNPGRDLNRQELAVALYGFAGYKGVDQSGTGDLSKYTDSGDVAPWAQTAVAWAEARGMLHTEGGVLTPTAPVQRAELAYALMNLALGGSEADQVRLLAGTRLESGAKLEVKDCAVKIQYDFHLWDWSENELPLDETIKRAEAVAKANGYAPWTDADSGSKVYVPNPFDDGTGTGLITAIEDGTSRSGVLAAEQGADRSFAQSCVIWDGDGWDGWRVYYVEEWDYYEEDGRQNPCFFMILIPASSADSSSQEPGEIEDWRTEQKIVVNGNTYQFLAKAMFSEEGDPLTVRLESDVQLTGTPVILGTSDYGGMFNGMEMTIPSRNIVLDLNGHTLTAEKGCAVFEVQDGYTLTVVDNSEGKGGRLSADGEAVIVEDGGTYVPLTD